MNFRKLICRAGAVLALSLGGCTASAQPDPHTPPAGALPGPALWQVSDEDTTIYLFGTVHALPRQAVWYDERIERAFSASDELVTEIDMADQTTAAQMLGQAAMLQGDETLRSLMEEEDRVEYEAALAGLGLPAEALDRVEPWFAALNLSMLPLMQSGYDPAAGVEMVLSEGGGTKKRAALETIEEQIALFDMLPMEAQLKLLDETVEAVPNTAATLDAMVQLWLAGDARGLAAEMNEELDDPALYQRLLVDRNARWVEWIEQRLDEPGTAFVAVGAGHLAGEGSVQDILGQRGVVVTRIWE